MKKLYKHHKELIVTAIDSILKREEEIKLLHQKASSKLLEPEISLELDMYNARYM